MPKILIEKNIAIEEGSPSKTIYPWADMKVGDSFSAGNYTRARACSIYGSISYFKGKKKSNKSKRFSIRKTEDGKIRVWRLA